MDLNVIYNLFSSEAGIKYENENANVAVVIFICKPIREPIVYDVTGIEDTNKIDRLVRSHVLALTYGCSYKYEFVKKVGNVYFYK